MARKLRKTFSGRDEEVWVSENGGVFDAYDLKDWYLSLPTDIQKRILGLHHTAEAKSGLMMQWKESEMLSGYVEIHRQIIDRWRWTYSSVPPLLNELFDIAFKHDDEVSELVLTEWLHRSKRARSYGAQYSALNAATEFHWFRGYKEAKLIREQGIYNDDLRLVEKYSKEMLGLLVKQRLPLDLGQCKPIERLCLLYKLAGRGEEIELILEKINTAGYSKIVVRI